MKCILEVCHRPWLRHFYVLCRTCVEMSFKLFLFVSIHVLFSWIWNVVLIQFFLKDTGISAEMVWSSLSSMTTIRISFDHVCSEVIRISPLLRHRESCQETSLYNRNSKKMFASWLNIEILHCVWRWQDSKLHRKDRRSRVWRDLTDDTIIFHKMHILFENNTQRWWLRTVRRTHHTHQSPRSFRFACIVHNLSSSMTTWKNTQQCWKTEISQHRLCWSFCVSNMCDTNNTSVVFICIRFSFISQLDFQYIHRTSYPHVTEDDDHSCCRCDLTFSCGSSVLFVNRICVSSFVVIQKRMEERSRKVFWKRKCSSSIPNLHWHDFMQSKSKVYVGVTSCACSCEEKSNMTQDDKM